MAAHKNNTDLIIIIPTDKILDFLGGGGGFI